MKKILFLLVIASVIGCKKTATVVIYNSTGAKVNYKVRNDNNAAVAEGTIELFGKASHDLEFGNYEVDANNRRYPFTLKSRLDDDVRITH